jgi:hypothetical protein
MTDTAEDRPPSTEAWQAARDLVDGWLTEQLADNPVVEAVEHEDGDVCRWYVRLAGEAKETFAVWFTLRQRTLALESYFTPAPEENEAAFYRHLLVRNFDMAGMSFGVGGEEAIFLTGQVGIEHLSATELDRLLGSAYAYVERSFQPALRLGFATRLAAMEAAADSGT